MIKVLFVIESFDLNGANKSLMSLLKTVDYSKYDVDLYAFIHRGPLKCELPGDVTLLPEMPETRLYKQTLKNALKSKKIKVCIRRLESVFFKNFSPVKAQKIRRKIWMDCDSLKEKYDLAIGYCEGESQLFVLNKTSAGKKVGWVHVDATHISGNKTEYGKIFGALDCCVTVSQDSRDSLKKVFDLPDEKVKLLHNIVNKDEVIRLSREPISIPSYDEKKINLLTIGRLTKHKNIDLAIKAASILKKSGYDFIWRVAGDGGEHGNLVKLISLYDVEDCFILLGAVDNPYSLLGRCDIYIQPSECEGWGLAVEEARILGRPIIVSDIAVFREQITHRVNGVVVKREAEELARAIKTLINDPNMREDLSKRLMQENDNNIQKDYIKELLS